MRKRLFSIISLICIACAAQAQELTCKVKVMHDKIQGVDKEVFTSMERNIIEFMNTRKWTNDQYGTSEKIECNILINLFNKVDQSSFEGTISIQASRPVYNTNYNTPTVNFVDRDLKFSYSQYVPLQFEDNRVSGNDPMVSNLTAVLAYYSYLILGLDYDSFAPNGGADLFKKAQNVVNNAPESGKTITGWKAVEGNKNRYWIIDQIQNPRFAAFRTYWYSMHREGLDNMYKKPEEAKKVVLDGIPKLVQLNKENPGSILLQFFFNAKSDELVNIVAQVPREQRLSYIGMLQQVDVTNAQKYNNLK